MATSRLDRVSVDVVAVDRDGRVGAGDADRGPTVAAADVGHPAPVSEHAVQPGHEGQPVRAEHLQEERAARVRLGGAHQLAVLAPADPLAGPVGVQESRQLHRGRCDHPGEGSRVRQAVAVAEDSRVGVAQPVAPLVCSGGRVQHLDEPGDGLLLEPLAGVPRVCPARGGDLGDVERAASVQQVVEAQLVADVDREDVEGAEQGGEHPIGEGAGRFLGPVMGAGSFDGHGVSDVSDGRCVAPSVGDRADRALTGG